MSLSQAREQWGVERIHLVGIGGAGMSGIAEVLDALGFVVSGSDLAGNESTERLKHLGCQIYLGHQAGWVNGVDLVVYSSAVAQDNPEILAAREKGIRLVRRAEMLGELMRLKRGIAVAGTHGKTTTTSLVATVLTSVGLDPTVLVGGRLRKTGSGARCGSGQYLIAEADEFDRSFLQLHPRIAVVTTLEEDHLDTYGDFKAIFEAFVEFANRVPFYGRVILCHDDPKVRQLLPRLKGQPVVAYGLQDTGVENLLACDVECLGTSTRFTVRARENEAGDLETLGSVELPLPGDHNVQNALAAVAVGLAVGLSFDDVATALASFEGVHRRFETLGEWHGATVVDDYAHHPTELAATLKAAKDVFCPGRVHAVFQPHLFSRTRDQADEFGKALLMADSAVVTGIYGSREQPLAGVSSTLVVEAAKRQGHERVELCEDWRQVPEILEPRIESGDAVLTLGAGDIFQLGRQLAGEAA